MSSKVEKDRKEFDRISKLMMEFLDNNYHPHTTVIITSTKSELVEGVLCIANKKYLP